MSLLLTGVVTLVSYFLLLFTYFNCQKNEGNKRDFVWQWVNSTFSNKKKYVVEHLRKKILPSSGPRIGDANGPLVPQGPIGPLGPLSSTGPGVALRTKKKKITSLSFGVSIVYFKVYGRYQFQFNKIGGPQDTHVMPGEPVKQNRKYSKNVVFFTILKNILLVIFLLWHPN